MVTAKKSRVAYTDTYWKQWDKRVHANFDVLEECKVKITQKRLTEEDGKRYDQALYFEWMRSFRNLSPREITRNINHLIKTGTVRPSDAEGYSEYLSVNDFRIK